MRDALLIGDSILDDAPCVHGGTDGGTHLRARPPADATTFDAARPFAAV